MQFWCFCFSLEFNDTLNSDLVCVICSFSSANNNLRGRLPAEVGLFTELQVLDVRNNQIQESIPDSICAQCEPIG